MIQAIIFDCFGVLVGHGYWRVFEQLGGDVDRDADFINSILTATDLGEITLAEEYRQTAAHLGLTEAKVAPAYAKDETPNVAILEFIRTNLKGKLKIGLLTNSNETVRQKLGEQNMALFDAAIISGEVGMLKPDPNIYKLALEKLGVTAEEALFVDDHKAFVDGAAAIGMQTHHYSNLENFKEYLNLQLGDITNIGL